MPKRRSARAPRQFSPSSPSRRCPRAAAGLARRSSTPANKSLRADRGQEAGVRGIPSPFINLDERGRDTPPPSLRPLLPRKDLFVGSRSTLGSEILRRAVRVVQVATDGGLRLQRFPERVVPDRARDSGGGQLPRAGLGPEAACDLTQ